MAKVIPARGTPEPFSDVGRNGHGGAAQLCRQSVSFHIRKLASDSIDFDE
jgi:hypothetical protein